MGKGIGPRKWALWVKGGGYAWELYGTGYLYNTEEGANRGLSRLVEKGELQLRPDGTYRTIVMYREVKVDTLV